MAITPVQVPSARPRERKKSVMEQIAEGVDIASKVLGTGVNAYKVFGIDAANAEDEKKYRQSVVENQKQDNAIKLASELRPGSEEEIAKKLTMSVPGFEGQYMPREKQNPVQEMAALLGLKLKEKELETANKPKLPSFEEPVVKDMNTDMEKLLTSGNFLEEKLNLARDPKVNPEVAISIRQEMLKKMNDPINSDAIGKEEVNRLGSLLKNKVFNVTEPGSFVGRDLDLFDQQAESAIKAIRATAAQKQHRLEMKLKQYNVEVPKMGEIHQSLGGSGAPKVGDVVDGYRYIGGDPAKQDNWSKVK